MLYNRLRLIILSALFVLITCFSTSAEETTSTNVIYLLDVSGSMKEKGLFENIKGRLKELVGERKVGDTVILGTFSENVLWPLKVEIRTPEDISEIKKIIDNLKAEGPWTWMSKAFKETIEKAQDIRAKSPESRVMIYMLTDCINDPPPEVKRIEPPWIFIEVLLHYFEGFKAKDTYVYLLSYRPLEPEEREKIEEKTVIVPVYPETKKFPRIVLTISGFMFGQIDLSKGDVTRSGEISIADFQDIEPGEKVQLIPPPGFKVEPGTIVCKERGQKEKVTIIIPSSIQIGKHTEIVKLYCEKAVVEPPELEFSFFVEMKPKAGIMDKLLKMLLPLLILIILFIIYDTFIRSKTIWVEKTDELRAEEIELKGWKKVYLGEKLADKYVTFGLPKHYLQRIRLKGHVVLRDEGGDKNKIIFGEDIKCKDPDGNEVSLRFYENEPIKETIEQIGQEPEAPSIILDRIEGKDE